MTQEVRKTEEQPPSVPEATEPVKADEAREMKLDSDDRTPEEAGYGYGV